MTHRRPGFTLLEILLVVAAIGILAAIVILAINPNRQLAKVRDAERQSEVNTLYDGIQQYNIDNGGQWPGKIESMSENGAEEICADGENDDSCINLTDDLVPTYLAEVPSDPQAEEPGSGYVVSKQNNRVRVSADAEVSEDVIAAGYSSDYVLDENPSAGAAYSVRRLRAGYPGPAITIRKGSGGTKDIGFTEEGNLDTGAITDFISSSEEAFVTTWYDQSGNGNNATQTTDNYQPKIAINGAVTTASGRPAVDFDGSYDRMFTNYSLGETYSHFLAGKQTASGKTRMISSGNTPGKQLSFNRSGNAINNRLTVVDDTTGTPGTNFALGAMIVGTESRVYINGNDVTDKANRSGYTWGSVVIGAGTFHGSEDPTMRFSELITYDSNQTENRNAIESNINGYYDIY